MTTDQVLTDLARDRGRELVAYAYMFTGDMAAAQDLVQDAFVKVFGRFRTGFSLDAADAYTRRTIATLYIDGYRRRRRWASVEHLLVTPVVVDAGAGERVDLEAALGVLSRQERACVVLRYLADRTVPEVARELHLAEGSVKRYLSNAMHKLESHVGPLDAGPEENIDVLPTGQHGRRS